MFKTRNLLKFFAQAEPLGFTFIVLAILSHRIERLNYLSDRFLQNGDCHLHDLFVNIRSNMATCLLSGC